MMVCICVVTYPTSSQPPLYCARKQQTRKLRFGFNLNELDTQ